MSIEVKFCPQCGRDDGLAPGITEDGDGVNSCIHCGWTYSQFEDFNTLICPCCKKSNWSLSSLRNMNGARLDCVECGWGMQSV